MDKKELERRLEAAEKQNLGLLDEIKNLKSKLAEMQEKPEIPDMPVFHANEKYWSTYPTLRHIVKHVLPSDYVGECFNLFRTKEMAQEFTKKCKLIAMMLHCKWYVDREYVPDFTNISEEKYFVCYDHVDGCFKYGLEHLFDYCAISFSTEAAAQKCVDWSGGSA